MDEQLISQLLLRSKPRFNFAEPLRALAYGLGGRATEYRPIQNKQDNEINDYIVKLLLKKQLDPEVKSYAPTTREEYLDNQKKINEMRWNQKEQPTLQDSIVNVMAGIMPPEQLPSSALQPEEIPTTVGPAEGGMVIPTPGQKNEYLPGYEPQPFLPAVPAVLRNKFGVTQQEASRKALGMGVPKQENSYKNVDALIKNLQKMGDYGTVKVIERAKAKGMSPEEIYNLVEEYQNAN